MTTLTSLEIQATNGLLASELLGQLNSVEASNAPQRLFAAGDTSLLDVNPKISIVGSRKVSKEGRARTRKLVKKLVSRNAVIVSGLAEGVDTEAHTTTIENGGKTIAVIGTPLNRVYPKQNARLQDEIAKNHLLLSQFPAGTATQSKNFPIRNRTMALISNCTIIVEAGEKSGTIHQGWEALRLGRPLFLLKSQVDKGYSWVDEFLEYGAEPIGEDNFDELMERLYWDEPLPEDYESPF